MPKGKKGLSPRTSSSASSTGTEAVPPARTQNLTSSSRSSLTPEEKAQLDAEIEERVRAESEPLSLNELVSSCHSWGAKTAHRGMGKERLIEYLVDPSIPLGASPVDRLRQKIMTAIKEGIVEIDCHGNCYQHSDPKVVQCALVLQRRRDSSL